ncbi:hypothetical protein I551_3614 [Mycobacterium ulcerans str. Harvey]|uniref:Uncharacterized protein n=1 Tax=Mycobacterium ulcerans str. Harvey TaxID=1299332 RepID=A0ABP3AIN8_MYCUL|nr:hypothetical protein I551_3614 [Mycobacterium ulcerans str. Harvey]
MQPGHVVAGGVSGGEFGDDLLEGERTGVDDFRLNRTVSE